MGRTEMDKESIEKLTETLVKVCNKYIDDKKMSTEDVYGALCGTSFLIIKASKQANIDDSSSILEENLK